jgi:hypothetical protein
MHDLGKQASHQVFGPGQDMTEDLASGVFEPQRRFDREGALYVATTGAFPAGVGATARIAVEGRLSPDAGWAEYDAYNFDNMNAAGVTRRQMRGFLKLMPQMRFVFRDTNDPALNGKTITVSLVE